MAGLSLQSYIQRKKEEKENALLNGEEVPMVKSVQEAEDDADTESSDDSWYADTEEEGEITEETEIQGSVQVNDGSVAVEQPAGAMAEGCFDDLQVALDAAYSSFEASLAAVCQEDVANTASKMVVLSVPADIETSSDEDTSEDGDSEETEDEAERMTDDKMQKTAKSSLKNDEGDDDEAAVTDIPKTKNEVDALPPVEAPAIHKIPEEHPMNEIGKISCVIDCMVVVQSHPNMLALDAGSILAFQDRLVLGEIFETFGPIHQPFYSVRFNKDEDIDKEKCIVGIPIYQSSEYSKIVFTALLRAQKGTDASNIYDEELPDDEQDFSDDEKEQEYKRMIKSKKKGPKPDNERMRPQPPQFAQQPPRMPPSSNKSNHSQFNRYPQQQQPQQMQSMMPQMQMPQMPMYQPQFNYHQPQMQMPQVNLQPIYNPAAALAPFSSQSIPQYQPQQNYYYQQQMQGQAQGQTAAELMEQISRLQNALAQAQQQQQQPPPNNHFVHYGSRFPK